MKVLMVVMVVFSLLMCGCTSNGTSNSDKSADILTRLSKDCSGTVVTKISYTSFGSEISVTCEETVEQRGKK